MGAGAGSLGEDPSQRGGAGRVARQGPLRWVIAVGSGAPVGWPGADLDGSAHRVGAGAHPRAGADRVEPEPDRRWANIHKENAEVVEVVAHLVAIERALDTLTVEGEPR